VVNFAASVQITGPNGPSSSTQPRCSASGLFSLDRGAWKRTSVAISRQRIVLQRRRCRTGEEPGRNLMTLAQDRLGTLAAWLISSSGPRRTPMGRDTLIGPIGVIVPSNFPEPPLTRFAEGALPIYAPAEQCLGVPLPLIVVKAPPSQDRMWAV
jgi:hypothetical protein